MTNGAALVREARDHAGLSRRALATRADVAISTVSRVEEERSDPTVTMLDRLLHAAGRRLVMTAVRLDDRPTLAEQSNASDETAGRLRIDWTRLRGFVDWADRHAGHLPEAIADPPARSGTPLDAILAGLAEELADQHGIDRPPWTRAVGRLDRPWAPPGTPLMQATAEATTPEPIRRRNVVLARTALFRSGG